MVTTVDQEALGEQRVCWACVKDDFLSAQIEKTGSSAVCTYCEVEQSTLALSEIGQLIIDGVEAHYQVVGEHNGEDLNFVIQEQAEVDEPLASDLVTWIQDETDDFDRAKDGERQRFDDDNYYRVAEASDGELQGAWSAFEENLWSKSRFFGRAAERMFETIFKRLTELRAAEGAPVIVEAGPGKKISELYRGRVFFADDRLHETLMYPHRHLGPPPSHLAIAGRMNPQGIAVFYGATSLETVLCETRPPVGSNVVVAKFSVLRDLKLLDVSAFKKIVTPGSIFDADFMAQRQRATFLNRLANRISRPVMPGDEPFEYLSTQAMAEYFAEIHEPRLDGMIYGSSQAGLQASNVVLFHHAARVIDYTVPPDVAMRISRDYGHPDDGDPSTTYLVWERKPDSPPPTPAEAADLNLGPVPEPARAYDARLPSLQLVLDSVTVCTIGPMEPNYVDHAVERRDEAELDKLPF